MSLEKTSIATAEKEGQEQGKGNPLFEKARGLLDHMTIPNRKTIEKWLAGAMAGAAVMVATETQNVEGHTNMQELKLEQKFTPVIQEAIKESRTKMSFEKDPGTHSVAAYLGTSIENINEGAIYVSSHETLDDDRAYGESYNREVPMSGNDIYLISKTAMAVAEEVKEVDGEDKDVSMFNGIKSDTRTFTFDTIEVDPVSESEGFEGSGITKSEAILAALEEGVGFFHGIQIEGERELSKEYEESGDKSNYEEKFVRLTSSSRSGFIDHYKVESIEMDEDGGYTAKVNMVFGEQPQFQLPDGVQLADSSSKPYYEINTIEE